MPERDYPTYTPEPTEPGYPYRLPSRPDNKAKKGWVWQLTALVCVALVVILVFIVILQAAIRGSSQNPTGNTQGPVTTQPTPTPTPSAVFTTGTWQGQGTYYNGQSPYDMLLNITSVNASTFSGTLREDTYNSTVAITGSITNSSSNSVDITFTDYATVSGDQIQLNCTYTATVSGSQMNGVWRYPGDSSPDGTISLNKTA